MSGLTTSLIPEGSETSTEPSTVAAPVEKPPVRPPSIKKFRLRLNTRTGSILEDKPIATFLDNDKRKPWDIKVGDEVTALIPKSILLYARLAFIFGYANANAFLGYGVYATLMTGNLINCLLALRENDYSRAYFTASILTTHLIVGTTIGFLVLQRFPDKSSALGVILIIVIASCLGKEALDSIGDQNYRYSLCLLSCSFGALAFWSLKTGYIITLLTNNFMKSMEFLLKVSFGYHPGDPKCLGDMVTVAVIIGFYCIGAVLSANILPRNAKLMPVIGLALITIVTECWEVWGIRNLFRKKKKSQPPPPGIELNV